ncbi:MAG: hypothetical protein KC474_08070, partial [Cyanobacteria bacterium HKST-UBA04]|nr:hypothetical protein [Cyanobacteria bacterium HKST-UBA04]
RMFGWVQDYVNGEIDQVAHQQAGAVTNQRFGEKALVDNAHLFANSMVQAGLRLEDKTGFLPFYPFISKHDQVEERTAVALARTPEGFVGKLDLKQAGSESPLYMLKVYRGNEYQYIPDPFSLHQPMDVHGPSQVTRLDYPWSAESRAFWDAPKHQGRFMIHKLHVGAFTPEGTFDAALKKMQALKAADRFNYTAIEFNPVQEFPGDANWGYDFAYHFATENSYGPPKDLQRLVEWCHENGIAVMFDLVFNHVGGEGNYLNALDPAIMNNEAPLGGKLNWQNKPGDVPLQIARDTVRHIIENFHADGARLDATYTGFGNVVENWVLQDLARYIRQPVNQGGLGRSQFFMVHEDYRPDKTVVTRSPDAGGNGANARYDDESMVALRQLLAQVNHHYQVSPQDAGVAIFHHLSTSPERDTMYGPMEGFVRSFQGHDIIGNRDNSNPGRRIVPQLLEDVVKDTNRESFEVRNRRAFKLAQMGSIINILLPGVPKLFMGEDFGSQSPFYFMKSGFNLADYMGAMLDRALSGDGPRPEYDMFPVMGSSHPDVLKASKLDWSVLRAGSYEDHYQQNVQNALKLRQAVPALWQSQWTFVQHEAGYQHHFTDPDQYRFLYQPQPGVMAVYRRGRTMQPRRNGSDMPCACHIATDPKHPSEVVILANFNGPNTGNGKPSIDVNLNTLNGAIPGLPEQPAHSRPADHWQLSYATNPYAGLHGDTVTIPEHTIVVLESKGTRKQSEALLGPSLLQRKGDQILPAEGQMPLQHDDLADHFVLLPTPGAEYERV